METSVISSKIDIIDKGFVEELIYVLLTKKDSSLEEDLLYTLKKALEINFFDIAFTSMDTDNIMLKEILLLAIRKRLHGTPLSVIREELLNTSSISKRVEYILKKYENSDTANNLHHYIKLLKQKLKMLAVYKFLMQFYDISTQAFKQVGDIDTNLQKILSVVNELYVDVNFDSITQEIDFSDPEQTEKRFEHYIEEIVNEEKDRNIIKTGIKLLDAVFDRRGLRKKNVYMFSAPYGLGKTRFVSYIGANIFKQGFNVYHITIENDKSEISFIYDLHFLGLSYDEFRAFVKNQGVEQAKELVNTIKGIMNAYRQEYGNVLEIKKFSPYKVCAKDIEVYINRKIEAGFPKPDVLIIDHIDILIPNKGYVRDLFERLELITSELKDLAERYDIAIIVPSQLNREGAKNSRGDISLGGGEVISRSMAKNELVSFHATLMQSPEEEVYDYMRIYIDKNRFGLSRCIFPIVFNKERIEVEDVITDEDFERYEGIVFPEKDTDNEKVRKSKEYKNKERVLKLIKMWIETLRDRADDNFTEYVEKFNQIKKNYLEYLKEQHIEEEIKSTSSLEGEPETIDDNQEEILYENDSFEDYIDVENGNNSNEEKIKITDIQLLNDSKINEIVETTEEDDDDKVDNLNTQKETIKDINKKDINKQETSIGNGNDGGNSNGKLLHSENYIVTKDFVEFIDGKQTIAIEKKNNENILDYIHAKIENATKLSIQYFKDNGINISNEDRYIHYILTFLNTISVKDYIKLKGEYNYNGIHLGDGSIIMTYTKDNSSKTIVFDTSIPENRKLIEVLRMIATKFIKQPDKIDSHVKELSVKLNIPSDVLRSFNRVLKHITKINKQINLNQLNRINA